MNVIVQHGLQSQWLLLGYTTTSVHQNNKVPYEYSTAWKLFWAPEATLSHCLETISKPSSVISTGNDYFWRTWDIPLPKIHRALRILVWNYSLSNVLIFYFYWNFKYEANIMFKLEPHYLNENNIKWGRGTIYFNYTVFGLRLLIC